ncbi:MAG: CHAT domain-containing tetratricopeptide repeat protein [Planctomycetota bacterium]
MAADLARRVPPPDGARLEAFVASRRGRPVDAALRRRVEAAEAQNDAQAFATALATIDGIGDGLVDGLAEASAVLGARAWAERGTALWRLGRPAEAAAAYVASAARAEAVGWGTWACDCLGFAWQQARRAGDAEGARRAAERAVAVAKAEPDPVREGEGWVRVGQSALASRRAADGVAAFDAAIEAFRRGGAARAAALALAGAFRARQAAAAPPEEIAAAADRLARAWDGRSAWTRDGWTGAALAEACLLLQRDAGAVDAAERLVADGRRDGVRDVEAVGWELAARAHRAAGRPRSAVLAAERSIALRTEPGERGNVATLLVSVANGYRELGRYALAAAALDRAVELDRALYGGPRPLTLISRGLLEKAVGDFDAAGRSFAAVLAAAEAAGEPRAVADAASNLGTLRYEAGDLEGARVLHGRARTIRRALGPPAALAASLGSLALVAGDLKDPATARALLEEALVLQRRAGDVLGEARTRLNLGWALEALGDVAGAETEVRAALAAARASGSADLVRGSLHGLAYLCARTDRLADALHHAREATELVGEVASGLGDASAVRVRGATGRTADLGVRIADAAGDLDAMAYFAECGRGGALLEDLRTRAALAHGEVPADLRALETAARAREAAAVRAFREVDGRGDGDAIVARRRELETVRDDLRDLVERIERDARRRAGSVAAPVASLAAVRGRRGADEAFVWYVTSVDDPVALVATRDRAWRVRLGPAVGLADACDTLLTSIVTGGDGVGAAVERLRGLVVAPLAVPAGVRRWIVSPDGPLSQVPFGLLVPGAEVVLATCATALVRGARDEPSGTRVLALGDPVYDGERPPPVPSASRGGHGVLDRLPASGDEARAVGDVVLVRGDATEGALVAALARPERWRSVHLACHGRFDVARPEFSALVLTPDAADDGDLTALEVSRWTVSTDLVVLSACSTGRGRVVRGEGAIGFARAFLRAGAPRVVCALWRVNDAASAAFMARFYAAYRPRDGTAPRSAAAALREAQAAVASDPRFAHPVFWAAWVLWGRPD